MPLSTVIVCGDIALPYDGLVGLQDVLALIDVLIGRVEPLPAQLFSGDVGVENENGAAGDGGISLGDVILLIQHITGGAVIGGCGS